MAGHEAGVIGIAGDGKEGNRFIRAQKLWKVKGLLSVNRRVSPFQNGRTVILKALVKSDLQSG